MAEESFIRSLQLSVQDSSPFGQAMYTFFINYFLSNSFTRILPKDNLLTLDLMLLSFTKTCSKFCGLLQPQQLPLFTTTQKRSQFSLTLWMVFDEEFYPSHIGLSLTQWTYYNSNEYIQRICNRVDTLIF